MAYSFYGGKEGISFVIKDRFDSVAQMTSAFAKGGVYNTVGYGEFVIIDTLNKNDYENGTVYRRGFDYNTPRTTYKPERTDTETITITQGSLSKTVSNRIYWSDTHTLSKVDGVIIDTVKKGAFQTEKFLSAANKYIQAPGAGAIYVGRFAGPEGAPPLTELISWDDFVEVYDDAEEGDYNDQIEMSRSDGKVTDVAKGGYCVIRDKYGNIAHSYFSFDLPYDVFEMQAESVSPYGPTIQTVSKLPTTGTTDVYYQVGSTYYLYENGKWIVRSPWTVSKKVDGSTSIYSYGNLIREKQESDGHPYYHSYDIKVPKGIHGKNINQVGINLTGARNSNGDIDQSNHNYEWFFEATDYENSETGTLARTYLNNFHKVIDRITTNSQNPDSVYNRIARNTRYQAGTYVLLPSSHPNAGTYLLLCTASGATGYTTPSYLSINLSEGFHFTDGTVEWAVVYKETVPPGIATIHYTHDGNQDFNIRLLQSLECDNDGRLFAKYTDVSHRSYVGDNRSIIGVGYNSDPRVCRFYIKYNTYYRTPAGVIEPHSTFTYNAANTDVSIFPFTDTSGREIEYINEKIKFVVSIAINPTTKRLTITYNTGEQDILDVFKVIDHVSIRDTDKKLIIHYNTGEEDVLETFKTITSATIDDTSKRLIVTYNTGERDILDVFKVIDHIQIRDSDQRLVVYYNTGDEEVLETFKSILHTTIDDTSKRLTITYNTGEVDTLEVMRTVQRMYWNDDYKLVVVYNAADPDSGQPLEQVLEGYEMKYIEKLYINDDGDLSKEKYFQSDFIVGKDSSSVDGFKHEIKQVSVKPINEVIAIKLVGDNLMVLYSSPAYRASLTNTYMMQYQGVNYAWANLGPILSGEHIIGNFSTLQDLKTAYPYGFGKDTLGQPDPTTQNRMGWIATVGDAATGYQLYAYDYQPTIQGPDNWYLMQELGANMIDPRYSMIIAKDNGIGSPVDNLDVLLNPHGYWFVVSN